jgi:tRNA pseudouridine55 synthase
MVGLLLIDKPSGLTSHDVVDRVRRLTGVKRVGHAGTLDPFATGLLIVGVGREATREFPNLVGLDKEYEAEFVLGANSDTDDRTGVIARHDVPKQSLEKIASSASGLLAMTMRQFTGRIEQIPPTYSAIKIGGKKMYEAARAGKPLAAKPRQVTVYSFDLLPSNLPSNFEFLPLTFLIRVRIRCSSGTYIRSLARDLGAALGVGGYVQELRRTAIGPFRVEEAIPLSTLSSLSALSSLLPVNAILSRLPASARVEP